MIIRNKKYIIGFVILVLTLLFLIRPHYILTIEDRENGKKYEYLLKDKEFSLGYTHSVMKTEAEEIFTVEKDKKMRLIRTEYKSYGVGLPFLPEEGELEIKDGKFILNIDREFYKIPMVISPIGKHFLKIGDKKYMLSDILGDKPTKILISIKKDYRF